jgi:peptidyl-prolyl cis-trans isomerase A (cyclophilin A)
MKLVKFCCSLTIIVGWLAACTSPTTNTHLVIETQYGDIEVQLYTQQAPKSTSAILSYIDSGFYARSHFYRVLSEDNQTMGSAPASLIQAGLWGTREPRNYLKGIPHESTQTTGLRHLNGTLSLARQDTGTATTEFFICIGDQPGFDFGGENNADGQGYAVFGRVSKGMDVVKKIYRRPEENQYFNPKVAIINIRRK